MQVFTDGACSGNPGPGGWGWVTTDGQEGSGGEAQSTNQRMELQAVLEALRALEGPVEVHSDSTYVVNCFKDKWYEGWKKRGWRNANKKPVANRDIWEPLIDLYLERADEIRFVWVKGHSGVALNERADELAVAAAMAFKDAVAAEVAGQANAETARQAEALEAIDPPWPVGRAVWAVGATELDDDQTQTVGRLVAGLDRADDVLVSGLRRGTELVAAEAALRRGVQVAAVLPFADPAGRWSPQDKARFDAVLEQAAWVVVLPGDGAQPGRAVEARNGWISGHVVGALVVGDPQLEADLDEAGLSVLRG